MTLSTCSVSVSTASTLPAAALLDLGQTRGPVNHVSPPVVLPAGKHVQWSSRASQEGLADVPVENFETLQTIRSGVLYTSETLLAMNVCGTSQEGLADVDDAAVNSGLVPLVEKIEDIDGLRPRSGQGSVSGHGVDLRVFEDKDQDQPSETGLLEDIVIETPTMVCQIIIIIILTVIGLLQ